MDLNTVFKAAPFIAAIIGVGVKLFDYQSGKQSRLREEYLFAKKFFDDLQGAGKSHPYLRERGFQAIAGDTQLTADEIEYLLSLKSPARALRDYVTGRPYLEHLPQSGNLQLNFKQKYRNKFRRKARLYTRLVLYFVFAFVAFAPLIFGDLIGWDTSQTLTYFGASAILFLPTALFSMHGAVQIHRAEHLVANQHQHTERLLMS